MDMNYCKCALHAQVRKTSNSVFNPAQKDYERTSVSHITSSGVRGIGIEGAGRWEEPTRERDEAGPRFPRMLDGTEPEKADAAIPGCFVTDDRR